MTLVKCPGCGQTVASVASTCPRCKCVLSQHAPTKTGNSARLVCRSCSRQATGTVTCPFCGALFPTKLAIRPLRFVRSGLAVLVLVALGLWARATVGPGGATAHRAVAVAPIAAPGPTPTRAPDVAPLPAQEPPLHTKWTTTWVNVREGRGADAPVVAILTPGQQVDVREESGSRWLVYRAGKPIGYVARWLLRDSP